MRPIIPPPVLALLHAGAMALVERRFDLAPFVFPGQVYAAGAVFALGAAVIAVSVMAFWREKTTVNPLAPSQAHKLVVNGLYKVSRNPMYLGMALLLAGAALYLGEGAAFGFVALFVLLMNVLQIKPEEDALERKFGNDYLDYKRRVRRWI